MEQIIEACRQKGLGNSVGSHATGRHCAIINEVKEEHERDQRGFRIFICVVIYGASYLSIASMYSVEVIILMRSSVCSHVQVLSDLRSGGGGQVGKQ